MSKALIYKALSLLDDDVEQDKPLKRKVDSSIKQKKGKQKHKLKVASYKARSKGVLENSVSVDRTEENLKLLMQLKALKPKASVAQKVVEIYTKPTYSVEEFEEKSKKQKSILFDDDDDDDDKKDKKKRKKKKYDVDSW